MNLTCSHMQSQSYAFNEENTLVLLMMLQRTKKCYIAQQDHYRFEQLSSGHEEVRYA